MSEVKAVARIRERIASACARAGRNPEGVKLIAVTKGVAADRIARAVATGTIGDVAENRAQELVAKQETLRDVAVRWHFVGTLQRNKARAIVGKVVLVHSIDSLLLAEALGTAVRDGAARDAGIVQDVLLQVNASGESSKHGVSLEQAQDAATALATLDGLRLRGFMTIAPDGDPDGARACFRALRTLRDRVATDLPDATELSMGMSSDFEVAVEEGATLVRIGTAIFGARLKR